MVFSTELVQLRQACVQVYPAPDTKKGLPRFTIIICGKRHKMRFYPTTEKDCDRSGNTKPGTIVDRGVTEARNWDFFTSRVRLAWFRVRKVRSDDSMHMLNGGEQVQQPVLQQAFPWLLR